MASKRDEVFILGEEEVGIDPFGAPEEEPTATAGAPVPSRSLRLRAGWPLILGALALLLVLTSIGSSGGESAEPPRGQADVPAVGAAPKPPPIARAPAPPVRAARTSKRDRGRPRLRALPEEETEQAAPAPLAETESAPVVTYAPAPVPEAAPEPTPQGSAPAPASAQPAAAARLEFGIER